MDELEPETQKIILQEIEKWRKERLISDAGAAALSRRYQPPASQPAPQPLPAAVVPPAPRPSLMQTLTSESSIKTFLYLGAFFVLASAFILGMLLDFFAPAHFTHHRFSLCRRNLPTEKTPATSQLHPMAGHHGPGLDYF